MGLASMPVRDPHPRLLRRVGEAATATAEREGGTHHDRRTERLDEAHPVLDRLDHRALGHRLPDPRHQVAEPAAVLRRADRRQRRAQHPHPAALQHAGVVERHREVEAGLPAERRQQRVGPVLLDDPCQVAQASADR